MFSVDSLLQGLGVFVCVGAVVLLGLVAIASRILSNPRNTVTYRDNKGADGAGYRPIVTDDRDFGGVPTTGAVQEYERDYEVDPIIGSSGFEAGQDYGQTSVENLPDDQEQADFDHDQNG